MLLHDIRLQDLRRFRAPMAISGLQPGLNVLAGPNEAGKSTIVRAIRAAFFERHRSSTVQDLQPWGDSSAAPEVALRFEHDGVPYELAKRFLNRKRCDLLVGTQAHNGQDAEDLLARLMGFEFASRGGSKPEHWGIPGLLWIEQGTGQDWQPSVSHALDHLRGALGQGVDELAASSGDAVLAQVDALRAELLTAATNKPTGAYRDALADEGDAASAHEALQQRLATYRQQVDALASLRAAHADDARTQPWLSLQQRHDAALAAWQAVQTQTQELTRERARLLEWQQRRTLLQAQLTQHERGQAELAHCQTRCEQAQTAWDEARANVVSREQAWAEARTQWHQARDAWAQAQRVVQAAETRAQQQVWAQQHAELSATVAQARDWATKLQHTQDHVLPPAVSAADAKALSAAQDQWRDLAVRTRVLATRLQITLAPGQHLLLNGQVVSGDVMHNATGPTVLEWPGMGRVDITPGGEDLAALQAERDAVWARLVNLGQRLQLGPWDLGSEQGLVSQPGEGMVGSWLATCLDDARTRQHTHQQHEQTVQQAQQALALLAPQGLPALEARLAEAHARSQAGQREVLSDTPRATTPAESLEGDLFAEPATPAGPSSAQPEVLLDDARETARRALAHEQAINQRHEAAQQAWQTARQAEVAAQATSEHHVAERQRLLDRAHDPREQATLQQARAQLAEVLAQMTELEAGLQARQAQIDAAQPDVLQRDVTRFQRAADEARQSHQARQHELIRLETALQSEGAQGLDEQLAALDARWQQAQRRVAECQRRAEALTLLRDKLLAHRQMLTTRLQAPLQAHLQRYLRLLFPQSTLTLDEHLHATVLQRPGTSGAERAEVDALSFGAREQLGIISRLAYADLLREAGRPTLLILDDALVHSDAERLESMKQVLLDAAERHQILLFTCHPSRWRDLGVPLRTLPTANA